MPKVGDRKFGYDAKGKAAAEKEAKRTGKPMTMPSGMKPPFMKGKGKK